ncbi:MAG: MBL fold metallo-hydrolase, partial [Enterobacterales bacterium]|nr:MBL fold metallo-hydrolase [Enterobacterales bacterium]
ASILVDAGSGSSLNFEKSGANFNDLQAILLSHLHVDHSAALPVYVKAGYFTQRDSDLLVFGPNRGGRFPSTEEFVAALFSGKSASAYPYLSDNFDQPNGDEFRILPFSIDPGTTIWHRNLTDQIKLSAIAVQHGSIPALAWRVDIASCSVTFSGDFNASTGHLEQLAKNTDLLVAHNAIPEDAGEIANYLHATPSKIARVVEKSLTKRLLLSHFMNRTSQVKELTQKQIRNHYRGEIILAQDLMLIPLQ